MHSGCDWHVHSMFHPCPNGLTRLQYLGTRTPHYPTPRQGRRTMNTPPTQPGWYRTIESTSWLVYSLDEHGQWFAHMLNGELTPCDWVYLDQQGPIELIAPYRSPLITVKPLTRDDWQQLAVAKDEANEVAVAAIDDLADAIRLTVEYVGNETLPAIAGWSWFDALKKHRPEVAERFESDPVYLGVKREDG